MYYLFDSLCLSYRQEEHWKIEPISIEEREAEQAKQAEQVCDSLRSRPRLYVTCHDVFELLSFYLTN